MLLSYIFSYLSSHPSEALKVGKLKLFTNWSAFSLSIFFALEELCSKPSNSLSLFFIHVDIVLFRTPNFSDASLLVIPFSICLIIWHFSINFVFFSFCLTADILTQAFLIQNKTFTLCNILIAIEFSNIDHFCCICCVNGPLDEKKFEIEREIAARDHDFCSS